MLPAELVAVADTIVQAVKQLLLGITPSSGSLVTFYWGGDALEKETKDLAAWLSSRFSGVEAEVVYGGQPYYHYLVSVE